MPKINIDFKIILLLSALLSISLIILSSASAPGNILVYKQITRIVVGSAFMLLAAHIPTHIYYRFAPIIFFIIILSLIFVLGLGHISKGAQRWISLGIFNFQPSELMRIAVPLMLAWYLSHRDLPPDFLSIIIATGIILIPAFLIAKQPDLGTALLISISGFATLFATGIPIRFIAYFLSISSVAIPSMWFILHDYQKQRVLTLLNPERDPFGAGYHIIQSKIAIGSGGIFGKGWMNGTQSHLKFLPEHTTDFIFAQFTEEFGLAGASILLFIYILLLRSMFNISINSENVFNKILACNLTMIFFCYIFVNIGMVCGILPVVGVPLPFISYGGTSIVTLMISFGILMAINKNPGKNNAQTYI